MKSRRNSRLSVTSLCSSR